MTIAAARAMPNSLMVRSEPSADDVRPQLVAASLIAAMEVLDSKPDGAATPEDVAALIDPVITFLRAGLEAVKTPSEEARRRGLNVG
jgi:hypothetical protein